MKLTSYSSALRSNQMTKRNALFLLGPIKFEWINSNIPDPTSRLVLVARAFMDMEGVSEIALTGKIWAAAKISGKDKRRRVLQIIRDGVEGYEVISRVGKASLFKRRN